MSLRQECVVEVLVPRDDSYGSGYLISPRLVLTARHVVQAALPSELPLPPHGRLTAGLDTAAERSQAAVASVCRVRRLARAPGLPFHDAVVVWWHPDRDVDAALLLVVDAAWEPVPTPPLRWADLSGSDPVACTAVGFPATSATVDADGQLRDTRQLLGVLPPLSAYKRQRWSVHVAGNVGQVLTAESSWAGMSGAALFAQPSGPLLGIVEADADAADPGRLELRAQPSHTFAEEPTLLAWLTADGGRWTGVPLGRSSDDAPAAARVVGDRVSAGVRCWRDRDVQRAQLRELVLTRQRIVSVTGRRGIGKSAMVAKVLAAFEEPDPRRSPLEDLDGLVYLSTRTGRGSLTLARLYESLADLTPEHERERLLSRFVNAQADALPWLWRALAERRVVVVLDDLDDLQDTESGQLRDEDVAAFLDSACRTPVGQSIVVTSQRALRLGGDLDSHVVELPLSDGLADADALDVLRAVAPGGAGLDSLSDEQLLQAARKVHGIPRGLELLARLLSDDPFAAEEVLASESTPERLVRELVGRGWEDLDPIGRGVVGLLAAAGVPLPANAVPGLLVDLADAGAVRRVLGRLWRRREIAYDSASELVRLHPLDADHVRTTLLSAPDLVAHHRALAAWYRSQRRPIPALRQPHDAVPQVKEFEHRWSAGDEADALRDLSETADFLARTGEVGVLVAALRRAERSRLVGRAPVLWCRAAVEFFDGSLHAAQAALRQLLDLPSVELRTLPVDRAVVELRLGVVLRHSGRAVEAVPLLRRLATDASIARECRLGALFELALAHCYVRNLEGAEVAVDGMAELSRPEDPPLVRAHAADARALVALVSGRHDDAIAAVREGVAAYEDSPESDSAGFLHNVHGLVQLAQGRPRDAEQTLRRAGAQAETLQNLRLAGLCGYNLAWALLALGRRSEGAEAAAAAAELLRRNHASEAPVAEVLARLTSRTVRSSHDVRQDAELLRALSGHNPDVHQPSERELRQLVTTAQTAAE